MNTEYINLTEGTLQEGDEWAEWLPVVNGKEYTGSIRDTIFNRIKPEPTEAEKDLQCEIDMINAYLEQIDSNISDYDVQMFAQYVQDRLKGGDV